MTRTIANACTSLVLCLLASAPLALAGCVVTVGDSDSDSAATAGEDGHVLGAEASASCEAAVDAWPELIAAESLDDARSVYEGGPLQTYIQESDAVTERDDDGAILAALAGDQLSAIRPILEVAMTHRMRAEVSAPEALVENPYAAWDEAYCLWSGPLRDLALSAELAGDPVYDADIVETIDIAFIEGHKGIDGEVPQAFIDDWIVPAARQQIEKTLFRVLHRVVLDEAKSASEPAQARRALEHFQGLKDRLEGRNTPGIAVIEGMLAEPATLDVDELRRHLNIAFAKRTRKYCSEALESGSLGVPTGYKGAVEGVTYQALITPDMIATLGADFDAAAYLADWDAWVEEIESGDDIAAATALSERLVQWNCAYQTALGIAECTASEDEPEA